MTEALEPSDSGLPIDDEYKDLELTLAQQFEMNKLSRMVDSCQDPAKLRELTHKLLKAWFVQKAAVAYVMKQKLDEFSPLLPIDEES
jgi:hypothetical protein